MFRCDSWTFMYSNKCDLRMYISVIYRYVQVCFLNICWRWKVEIIIFVVLYMYTVDWTGMYAGTENPPRNLCKLIWKIRMLPKEKLCIWYWWEFFLGYLSSLLGSLCLGCWCCCCPAHPGWVAWSSGAGSWTPVGPAVSAKHNHR